MRIFAVWMVAVLGCTGLFSPSTTGALQERAFRCEGGTQTSDPEQTEKYRLLSGTEVTLCLDAQGIPDGSHIERIGERVTVEGAWKAGKREGLWTTWRPDGAFQSSATFKDGIEQGLIVAIGRDGLVTEIEMDNGSAISIRTKEDRTPMPEWEEGAKVLGTRYATPLAGG